MIGNKLKELREKKGINQKDLAKYLNLTQVQISKYELEKNEPDLNTTKKIAKFFNVTIDYLLGTPEENIILITKQDYQDLKKATNKINEIVNKIDSKEDKNQNSININGSVNNSFNNSFNNKK